MQTEQSWFFFPFLYIQRKRTSIDLSVPMNKVPTPFMNSPSLLVEPIVGRPFEWTSMDANGATVYTAVGLPIGLSINAATGRISGTPSEHGQSTVLVTATNISGDGTLTLNVRVQWPEATFQEIMTVILIVIGCVVPVGLMMAFVVFATRQRTEIH